MSEFENVTIVKKANLYFDGGVTSRTIRFADGSVKTLGMMQPGEYQFDTDKKEHMEMLQGKVSVLLPGESRWQEFGAGETFEIPASASFKITALELSDYCCSFID